MLLEIKPEYRAILQKSQNAVIDIPRSTPPHIVARLTAGAIAICEKRSVSTFDNLLYQDQAKHFHRGCPSAFDRRNAAKRPASETIDRRHGEIALRYKALGYEQIKHAVKFNYGEDTLNALNLAELGKQVRGSATYGDMNVQSPRQEPGQSQDPTASLRDGAFDFDGDDEWDKDEHERCAVWHRACARKAPTMNRGIEHYRCADLHDRAAECSSKQYPYDNSRAARRASRILRLAESVQ